MSLCGAALVFIYYPDLFSKKESEQSITTETVEKKKNRYGKFHWILLQKRILLSRW